MLLVVMYPIPRRPSLTHGVKLTRNSQYCTISCKGLNNEYLVKYEFYDVSTSGNATTTKKIFFNHNKNNCGSVVATFHSYLHQYI